MYWTGKCKLVTFYFSSCKIFSKALDTSLSMMKRCSLFSIATAFFVDECSWICCASVLPEAIMSRMVKISDFKVLT